MSLRSYNNFLDGPKDEEEPLDEPEDVDEPDEEDDG